MHVVDGHLTMEVVGDDGRIKATGTGDLLITNALNWRHAFIRYRIGDTATVSAGRCACGHNGQTIVALPGRERAAYNYGENVVAAADIAAVIEACDPPVKQYQVAYGEDGQITIKWIPDPSTPPARRSRTLAAAMQECFPGTRFELSRVTTINTPGGKLRRFL
jgi:phenylacetate-coenzyme A ligase PaaK-like adenylate-forming protein